MVKETANTFFSKDKNNDGVIDFSEFKTILSKHMDGGVLQTYLSLGAAAKADDKATEEARMREWFDALDRDGNGQWGGRVLSVRLAGTRGTVTVSGDALRFGLGLKSPWVTFRVRSR